jgi:hypothetical protein
VRLEGYGATTRFIGANPCLAEMGYEYTMHML